MDGKHLIVLVLLVTGCFGATVLACFSKRLRDLYFLMMVFFAPVTERMNINFLSRDFYRGTTRGIEISCIDVLSVSLLVSMVLFPRRGEKRIFWPASLGLMLIFFLYCCFNVAMADPKLFGIFELSKMVRGMTIFCATAMYVRSNREVKYFVLALAGAVCLQALLGLEQRYFEGIPRVYGTVDDSNSLSVFVCTAAPIFVAALNSRFSLSMRLLSIVTIVMAAVTVVLTISRAGVVIAGLVLLAAALATMSWKISARKFVIATVVILGATGILAKSWKTLESRFKDTDLAAEYKNKRNLGRGYYIRVANAIVEDKTFGVGLNNWSYWVSEKYGPKLGYRFVPYKGTDIEPPRKIPSGSNVDEAQAAPAHSLGALTAGELGWPGLILFTILWLRWFQMGASFLWQRSPEPFRRIAVGIFFGCCGLFLQNITEWAFRHSPIYYVIHIMLGVLASMYYGKKCEARARQVEATEEPNDFEDEYEPALAEGAAA